MLRQSINELKNYNFLTNLQPGVYIDAKDQGKWKVGQVQSVRKIGHKIVVDVMFDGYSPKYNESYDLPSYTKLAPFRKFTLPYTGHPYQEVRRQQPTKSLEHYIKLLKKKTADIQSLTADQINQLFRGQLCIFIDYPLTRVSKQQLKYAYDDYMRLFFAYMELLQKVFQKVFEFLKQVEKEGNLDQNFIYVHSKMALLYSLTQFLFNCNSMISNKQNRVTFHSNFGKHQSIESIYATFDQKMKSMKLYQKCQALMKFKTLNGKSLPWSIKKQALILLKSLNKQQPFLLPKQTKQIIQFIDYLPYFSRKSVINSEEQQKYRSQLIFNLILCGNFQGKLIGLNQIKKMISNAQYSTKGNKEMVQLIKQKKLVQYFLDNNNFNSELFKRALVIFQYAYRNKLFNKEHFTAVFRIHKDKHELELKNFYNSLAQFGQFLNELDAIQFFNEMIKQLPFQQNFIELIKNYTTVLIDKNSHYKKLYMTKDQVGFGLIYFWEHINNQSKVNKDLILKIIQAFATLLNNLYYSKHIERFIVSSIKAIKQNKNPQSFLKVIHQSLKLCKGPRMNKAIQIAQRQVNVIEAAMKMLREQQNNLSQTGFQNLFQFLEQVNYISKKGISQADILFMWKMDKKKCRGHLLKFLRKFKLKSNDQKSQQKIISKSLDITQIEFIIKNIFQSEDLMQGYKFIDQEHYQTIDQLILCYLHTKKIIDYNYKHTIRYKKNEFFADDDKMFLGMTFYLKCIQNNDQKYEDVSIKATKRLIDIFLRPSSDFKNVTECKVKNWLKVSRAFNELKRNKLRSLKIQLEQINGRMKSLNILEPQPVEIKTKIAGTNKMHTFIIPRYTSLWKFRLLINEHFQLNNTNFEIQLLEQQGTTNLQREEDLSVAFITTSRQRNGVSVVVNPSKQIHPHFKAIQKFKQELSDIYGQSLLKNLSSNTPQKVQISLEILFKLPFLKSYQKSLQAIQFKEWSELIDLSNMKKLEYQLSVIQKTKDFKWIMNFLSKNGLKHLAEVVLNNVGKNSYKTLNNLMSFFIEALKFMKNPLPFGEQFLKNILICEKQVTEDYVKFLLNCFTLIKQTCSKIKITSLFEKDKMNKILEAVLFASRNSSIAPNLIEICKVNNLFINLNKHLRIFLNTQYLNSRMYECKAYFEVIQILIEKGQLQLLLEPLQKILLQIRNSDIKQKSQNQTNHLLYGYLLSLYTFIKFNNNIEQILAEKKDKFCRYLLNECLFHPQNIAQRRFKSKQLRQLGFKFLEMMEYDIKNEQQINNLIIPMMSKGSWRKQFDWNIQPVEFVSKKFTGLKNLAATCYINSLLQQLFYITPFSSQLMNVDSGLIDEKQNVVRQIQNIFGFLKYSQNPSYTTLPLCQTFILDGQPIDPRVQTDVDEFFHALMDKLQRNLSKINKKQIINDLFRGEFSNLIIGQECPHTSQRIEHFLSIRLQIKNKKTIYQALDQFIKGQILEGENAYQCEKCDKKVKAMKRVCLKELPPVMIVTLKRFEFDFDTMEKFKLNTYCSFPQTINFLPYTKQGLQDQSQANKQDYEYKLKGVVIHYGISEAGHYTSYVRTASDQWNYFDDERISDFDLKNMQNQCFGGIEENPFGDDQDKKKNAYLLIYEKVNSKDQVKVVSQEVLSQSKVHQLVEQDNLRTKLVNILFQPNIENYLLNASELNPRAYLIYYHTVYLRSSRKRQKHVQFFTKCTELLAKKQVSQWYLSQITQAFLMQFVIYGQMEVRHIVTSLICQSLKQFVDLDFLQQCIGLLYVKNVNPFVKIFSAAVNAHPEYAKYLSSINFSEVVLNLIRGKQIKENNIIHKVKVRKQISEFGLAASGFIQRKNFDSKQLFLAIEYLKTGLSIEQIKQFALSIKSKRILKALALSISRKYKEINELKKLIDTLLSPQLMAFDAKTGEQSYFWFLIQLVEQLCKIKDKDQQQRVTILMRLYIEVMKESITGFKSELMLFNGFFRMALINLPIRNAINQILNDKDYKKFVISLKQWIKELPNAIQMIKNEKWGYWRKIKKNYPGLTTRDVQIQVKLPVKQSLSLLNSIIQKHLTEQSSEFLQPGDNGYIEQKYGPEYVKITRRMGLLVQVKDEEGNHKFVNQDDVVKKYI